MVTGGRGPVTFLAVAILANPSELEKDFPRKFYIAFARLLHPMYREKLVPGKSTSNFPVFHIRLVLKSLPPEIFTSFPGFSRIRWVLKRIVHY